MKYLLLLLPLLCLAGCAGHQTLSESESEADEAAMKAVKSVRIEPINYDEVVLGPDSPVDLADFRQACPDFEREFVNRLTESEGRPINAGRGEARLQTTVRRVVFGHASMFSASPGAIYGEVTLTQGDRQIWRALFHGEVKTGYSTWKGRIEAAHRDVGKAVALRLGNSYP